MMFALASEWDRLTPEQQAKVTWVIADDGDWTDAEIEAYIEKHFGVTELTCHPEDWSKPCGSK
jgi:hypothetical protein